MKFYLCHVPVRKYRRQKHNIKSAMIALDIKIKDWIDLTALSKNNQYIEPRRVQTEFSEIMGELKFLYQSDVLTAEEYRRIIKYLIGVDSEEEIEKDEEEIEFVTV